MYYESFDRPVALDFAITQWGALLSGAAPINGSAEKYMLGADIDESQVYDQTRSKFVFWLWFLGVFFVISSLAFLYKSLLRRGTTKS